ncbi:MAG: cation transporter [Kiloniellales bacterium]
MPIFRAAATIAAMLLASSAAFGAERTVMLTVDNMTCASCPYIVKQSLARVPGVSAVEVSFERKTAVVTFEDEKAGIADLTAATAKSGFPSRPIEQ